MAFGIKQAAIPIATLMAGVALPVVGMGIGWRWAYVGAAGMAAVALLIQRRMPSHTTRTASRPVDRTAPFQRRVLITLAVAVGFGAGSANVLGTFLVEFLASERMSLGTAGAVSPRPASWR